MSDEKLRELERRFKETGSVEDEAAWLKERVRVGDLTQERLELAAYCGHEGSRGALGANGRTPMALVYEREDEIPEADYAALGRSAWVQIGALLLTVAWELSQSHKPESRLERGKRIGLASSLLFGGTKDESRAESYLETISSSPQLQKYAQDLDRASQEEELDGWSMWVDTAITGVLLDANTFLHEQGWSELQSEAMARDDLPTTLWRERVWSGLALIAETAILASS